MPAPPPAEPPVVPGYLLEARLGRGGSGEVWRALPRGGGAPVAVKVLVAGDPERQAREAALLGELDHPHLVRLLDVVHQPRRGETARVALVLELLPGGSLAALLARRGRLRPGEVVTAVAPVAAALAYAHEHGVVHGDLSPGNIVFTAEGRPVLTDLGVARVLGEAASGEVTPAYVDPTVARGGAPGPASDVFGVAAAAFHALTGIPPWNAAGPEETLSVAAGGVLPELAELAPDAPPSLIAVVARGLSAEPADRGTAAEFALDLRHACRPEPVRLPVDGVPDTELGRTGHGPRTELTHQRASRPQFGDGHLPERGTAHRDRRASHRVPRTVARRPSRRTALLVLGIVVVGAAGWAGSRGLGGATATEPAAASAAASAVAGKPPVAAGSTTPAPTVAAASSANSSAAATRTAPSGTAGWRRLIDDLYRRRAAAFATGDGRALADVYTAASAQLAADRAGVAGLAAEQRRVRGFEPRVEQVTRATMSGNRATVTLVDSWPAYTVVDGLGRAVATVAARPATGVRMVLAGTAAGWRIERVERVD